TTGPGGNGAVTLQGNITLGDGTDTGDLTITGPITLAADVTISTDTATNDGNITFVGALSTINSDATARSLTLKADHGDVTLGGAVGAGAALSGFTITSAAHAALATVRTGSGGIAVAASTAIALAGNLNTDAAANAGP